MSDFKNGVVGGGKLYCRKQPSKSAHAWGQFNNGATIPVKEIEGNDTWYETYWNNDQSKVGYVMKTYVDAPVHPVRYTSFNVEKAVKYALNHSTKGSSGADPKRNTAFGNATSNDCSNFVSQCLVAGGLPMFNGWSYPLEGIPIAWESNSKWSLTYSGCSRLLNKERLTKLDHVTETKRGDIIYTYDSSQANTNYRYPHVTIATSNYDAGLEGCYICGHSINQNGDQGDFKKLKDATAHVYRVKTSVTVGETERQVTLPESGSGFTVVDDHY